MTIDDEIREKLYQLENENIELKKQFNQHTFEGFSFTGKEKGLLNMTSSTNICTNASS